MTTDFTGEAISLAAEIRKEFERCEIEVNRHDPEDVYEAIRWRVAALPKTGRWVARTEFFLNSEKKKCLEELGGGIKEFAPTILKEMLTARTATYQELAKLADRLNKSIVHDLDSLRSLLAYDREHLSNMGGGSGPGRFKE